MRLCILRKSEISSRVTVIRGVGQLKFRSVVYTSSTLNSAVPRKGILGDWNVIQGVYWNTGGRKKVPCETEEISGSGCEVWEEAGVCVALAHTNHYSSSFWQWCRSLHLRGRAGPLWPHTMLCNPFIPLVLRGCLAGEEGTPEPLPHHVGTGTRCFHRPSATSHGNSRLSYIDLSFKCCMIIVFLP